MHNLLHFKFFNFYVLLFHEFVNPVTFLQNVDRLHPWDVGFHFFCCWPSAIRLLSVSTLCEADQGHFLTCRPRHLTTVALANVNTVSNNGATTSVLVNTVAGVSFLTDADVVIGSTTVTLVFGLDSGELLWFFYLIYKNSMHIEWDIKLRYQQVRITQLLPKIDNLIPWCKTDQ